MKLSPDAVTAPRIITAESLALGRWYDSHPAVRRLWGIKQARKLRVIVAVEPTHDNDDISPAWFAYTGAWLRELQLQTGSPVRLEFIREPFDGIAVDAESVIIADLFWRDATLNQFWEVL